MARAFDIALLLFLKIGLGIWLIHLGFCQISDDDYARVVISQLFAHQPKLDPSGTSWLPFPFWLNGTFMLVFGRSLETARASAFLFNSLSIVVLYAAARSAGISRIAATLGLTAGLATPLHAWLNVATVPETITGTFIAAAALCCVASSAAASANNNVRLGGSRGLFAASLSRYEAWPICAVFAVYCMVDARKYRSRPLLVPAAIAVAGPMAWMAWNIHAHGSAIHFLHRVSAYRKSIGAAAIPLTEKLTTYPIAAILGAPEIAALCILGSTALVAHRPLRERWIRPLIFCASLLAFLVYGDVHDGAPTHHPERALISIYWLFALLGIDGLSSHWQQAPRTLQANSTLAKALRKPVHTIALCTLFYVVASRLPQRWAKYPGSRYLSPTDDRTAQIERGESLRQSLHDTHLPAIQIVPCEYEHFALLAASGTPEIASIAPSTHSPVTSSCPKVIPLSVP